MSDYDVVIIGSGIGATASGAILASNGLKILLVEKNNFIGGRCSTYEKDGFNMDVGIHLIGRTSKGPHGRILNMIGMEDAIEWVPLRKPGPRWYHQGKIWTFPREFKELVSESEFSKLMKVFRDLLRIKDTKELDKITVKSWLSKYSNNVLIHSFINTLCWLYFVFPYYEASAGEFVRCISSLSRDLSVGYPKGGCVSIPKAYAKGIKKYGGEIKTELHVKKVVIENNIAKGIELDNGEFISSNIVISNAGIIETVSNLVGRNYFNKTYLDGLDKLKYSMSGIMFKIALKKPITNFKVVSSFTSEDPEERFKSILAGKVPDETDLFIPVPSNFDPNLAPKGKQLIIAGTPVTLESFEKNREKWIKNSMESIENIFPELSDNLMWMDITTPQDIEFMAGKDASAIGLSQITGQTGIDRPSSVFPIEGLYLVGADTGKGGIGTELAALSAIECSEIILRKKR